MPKGARKRERVWWSWSIDTTVSPTFCNWLRGREYSSGVEEAEKINFPLRCNPIKWNDILYGTESWECKSVVSVNIGMQKVQSTQGDEEGMETWHVNAHLMGVGVQSTIDEGVTREGIVFWQNIHLGYIVNYVIFEYLKLGF